MDSGAASAVVKSRINGVLMNTLLDSGAGCSLIGVDLLNTIGKFDLTNSETTLYDASRNVIPVLGTVQMKVQVVGVKSYKDVTFYVTKSNMKMVILGRDFMKKFDTVTFNFKKNLVKLGDFVVSDLNKRGKERIRIATNRTLPAKSESIIDVKCKKGNGLMESEFKSGSLPGNPGVYMARARVVPNSKGIFHICVINTTDRDVVLQKHKVIGSLFPVKNNEDIVDVLTCDEKEKMFDRTHTDEVPFDINPSLSGEQKKKLEDLLKEYQDVFASNPKKHTVDGDRNVNFSNLLAIALAACSSS